MAEPLSPDERREIHWRGASYSTTAELMEALDRYQATVQAVENRLAGCRAHRENILTELTAATARAERAEAALRAHVGPGCKCQPCTEFRAALAPEQAP